MAERRIYTHSVARTVLRPILNQIRADHNIPTAFPQPCLAEARNAVTAWENWLSQHIDTTAPEVDDDIAPDAGHDMAHLVDPNNPLPAIAVTTGTTDTTGNVTPHQTPDSYLYPTADATAIPFITIDPESSKDLDQAVYLYRCATTPRHEPHSDAPDKQDAPGTPDQPTTPGTPDQPDLPENPATPALGTPNAAYVVCYAIASLSTFIAPGQELDHEVHRRGSTVYTPDEAVPLHPPILSHGAASLLPNRYAPAIVWRIALDETGHILAVDATRSVVKSRAKLSYEQVQALVDQHAGTPDEHNLAHILTTHSDAVSDPHTVSADQVALIQEVGEVLLAQQARRGGFSLQVPEQEIDATDAGYALTFRSTLPVEEWNAQFSLLTGMAAAATMRAAQVGIMRTVPPAQPERINRLRRIAAALHIHWAPDLDYASFLAECAGDTPAELAFFTEARGLFRGSGYDVFGAPGTPDVGQEKYLHGAIAAEYAHVTAPLRRLVDRYGQEICVAACAGHDIPNWVTDALSELPRTMADTGRRIRAVERDVIAAIEALLLHNRTGDRFDGVVVDVTEPRNTHGDNVHGSKGVIMISEPALLASVGTRCQPSGESADNRPGSRPPSAPEKGDSKPSESATQQGKPPSSCHPDLLELGTAITVALHEVNVEKRRVRFIYPA